MQIYILSAKNSDEALCDAADMIFTDSDATFVHLLLTVHPVFATAYLRLKD